MELPEVGPLSGFPGVTGMVDRTSDEAVTKNWVYNAGKMRTNTLHPFKQKPLIVSRGS